MIRRKPSKIEVKVEDRDELEEALRSRHQRPAVTGNSSTVGAASSTSAISLLQPLLAKKAALDPNEKAHILGIPQKP